MFSFHVGKPSKSLNGRAPIVASGRALGGGSSVNGKRVHAETRRKAHKMFLAMVYTRAAASDYDDWEKNYDNKGWASKDLIPLLNKVCVWIYFVPAFS